MENNSSISAVSIADTENTEIQTPVVEKKRKNTPLFILIICLIIATFVVAYFLYNRLYFSNSYKGMNVGSNQLIRPSPTVSQSVASKMKITDRDGNVIQPANLLSVKPLSSSINWQEETASSAANLNYNDLYYSVSEYPSYTKGKLLADGMYTLTGKVWKGSLQVKNLSSSDSAIDLENLEKAGWSNGSHLMNEIVLNDAKLVLLQPIEAGGPCGTVESFIAYKENYFRVLTVGERYSPCFGDGSITPTPTTYLKAYDVFLSDPVSFNDILLQYKSGKGITKF